MAIIYAVFGVGSMLAFFATGKHWRFRSALLCFGLILVCISIELADTRQCHQLKAMHQSVKKRA